jgi:hypothetical protein
MMRVKGLAPLYRNSHDLPWIPFTPYSTTVKLKLLQVNPVTGQVRWPHDRLARHAGDP